MTTPTVKTLAPLFLVFIRGDAVMMLQRLGPGSLGSGPLPYLDFAFASLDATDPEANPLGHTQTIFL